MKDYGVFDILGPVMVGPSSSHTAGAARLAKTSREIAGIGFYKVIFLLHGSFAKTYKGHGTDKALVAGILGLDPSDERLKSSLEMAKDKNIEIEFIEKDLGYEHPNTVRMIFKYKDKDDYYVQGSSIGGGSILISDINGKNVEFTGNYPTILLTYSDKRGIISHISSILAKNEINIANMKVTRENNIATMVCETDSAINQRILDEISNMNGISYIKFINPIKR